MNATTDKTIAVEILNQLGGNKFIAMTGARNFVCDNNSMAFKLSSTMTRNHINWVKITLNCMDTYDLEFVSIRGINIKKVSEISGVYNEDLRNIIADRTGLTLSL